MPAAFPSKVVAVAPFLDHFYVHFVAHSLKVRLGSAVVGLAVEFVEVQAKETGRTVEESLAALKPAVSAEHLMVKIVRQELCFPLAAASSALLHFASHLLVETDYYY